MYSIKRFSSYLLDKLFGRTTADKVGNGWRILKDSEIFSGARRVNDNVLYKYNQEWIVGNNNTYILEKTKGYLRDLRDGKIEGVDNFMSDDVQIINRYEKDLLNGLVGVDNPEKNPKYADGTHTLMDLSVKGKSIAYSKSINFYHRFTYEVLKPEVQSDGSTVTRIRLINCRGHRFNNKPYVFI